MRRRLIDTAMDLTADAVLAWGGLWFALGLGLMLAAEVLRPVERENDHA